MTNEQGIPVYLNCYGKYVTAWEALQTHRHEVVMRDGKIAVETTEVIGHDPDLAARIRSDLTACIAAIDKADAENARDRARWAEIASLCQPNGGDA